MQKKLAECLLRLNVLLVCVRVPVPRIGAACKKTRKIEKQKLRSMYLNFFPMRHNAKLDLWWRELATIIINRTQFRCTLETESALYWLWFRPHTRHTWHAEKEKLSSGCATHFVMMCANYFMTKVPRRCFIATQPSATRRFVKFLFSSA